MTTRGKLDILLVEDNSDHARFVLRALQENTGVRTSRVKEGEAALDFLRRYVEERHTAPARPLVVRKEAIAAACRAGANGYVTKPLKLGEFVEKRTSLVRHWTFTSEIPAA